MIDDSTPTSPDMVGLDAESAEPQTLTLTPDQLAALNLGDCAPGQTYKIELKYTGGGSPDAPPDLAPTPAPGGEGDAPAGDAGKSFTVVSSTTTTPPDDESDAGPDDLPPGTPDAAASPEEKVLGFKRTPKPMRAGLPSTKSIRDY